MVIFADSQDYSLQDHSLQVSVILIYHKALLQSQVTGIAIAVRLPQEV